MKENLTLGDKLNTIVLMEKLTMTFDNIIKPLIIIRHLAVG